MEFDPNAKARTASAALNTIKWIIWGIAALICLAVGMSWPANGETQVHSAILLIVGFGGYFLGRGIGKYRNSIINNDSN